MSSFEITLRTLTPLHIGDGDELRQDFDFVVRNNQTWRLDVDAILAAKYSQIRVSRDGRYPLPGKILQEADYANEAFFRYKLRGFPRSKREDARVKSFIKDVYDRPYIPGSSLKGAIRTALAWHGWREVKPAYNRSAVGRSRYWAGQDLEKKLFGPDPNHSLMRALEISDLGGRSQAGEGLILVNAQVLTKKSAGSPIELEALTGDLTFRGTLKIDNTLFSPQAEPELHFGNRRHWLEELSARIQRHSQARIERLLDWFERAEHTEVVAKFYRQLANAGLEPNQSIFQLGWGGGWDSKTFWTHLQSNPQLFEQLVGEFKLHRAGRDTPPRKTGDPFPRSKRAAMTVKDDIARPAAPFGWVLMELEEN